MQRLTCLLLLGAALMAGPVLAQGVGTLMPRMDSFPGTHNPCSAVNPCAVVTPALGLGSVTMPVPTEADAPADTDAAPKAPAKPGAAPAQTANANCPPAGARGGFFVTGPDAQAEQRNRT